MHLTIIPDIVKNQKIRGLPATATVREGAKEMLQANVAALVVVDDDGTLAGIVTERDMTRRVLAADVDAKTKTLGEIMTKDPDTLAPMDSALDALELMRVRGYRHLPVVEDGAVVGMISIRDLYAAVKGALEEDFRETKAFVFGDRYGA
jgi:CBS domain-containing protein